MIYIDKNLSEKEILQYVMDNNIIDLTYVQEQIENVKRNELLEKHTYQIYQGKDGKWYTYLPDEKKGRVLRKRNSERDIQSVVVEYWREQSENFTIREVFTEWNDRQLHLENIKKSTHLRNEQTFERHYKEFGNRKIRSVSQEQWEDFLQEEIAGHKITAKAFGNLRGITKGFLKRAKNRKLISFTADDIFESLDISKKTFKSIKKKDEEDAFQIDEYYQIVEFLSDKNNYTIHNLAILMMFVTGLRVGELVSLKYSDIDINVIHVYRTETRYQDENGKYVYAIADAPKTEAGVRDVPIPKDYQWIVKALRKINPFTEWIFTYKNERITTQAIRKRLYRLCIKLNIKPKSPHKARKTYASILIEAGVPEYIVRRIMGHTDSLTTEKYYHRKIDFNDTEIRLVSQIPAFMVK